MIERALWGRTAMDGRSGWRREFQHAASWLDLVTAALSHAEDANSSAPRADAETASTSRSAAAPGGDAHAQVTALYELHARSVPGYLCARLPTLDDAEGALAEVFFAALAQCAAGQSPGLGWLLTVARRRAAGTESPGHRVDDLLARA